MVVYIEDVDDVCMIPKLCCYWLLLFEFVSCDDIIRYFMTACYRMLSQDLDLCSIHDVISCKISRVSIQSIGRGIFYESHDAMISIYTRVQLIVSCHNINFICT